MLLYNLNEWHILNWHNPSFKWTQIEWTNTEDWMDKCWPKNICRDYEANIFSKLCLSTKKIAKMTNPNLYFDVLQFLFWWNLWCVGFTTNKMQAEKKLLHQSNPVLQSKEKKTI